MFLFTTVLISLPCDCM